MNVFAFHHVGDYLTFKVKLSPLAHDYADFDALLKSCLNWLCKFGGVC